MIMPLLLYAHEVFFGRSYLGAILAAEYALRLLPVGTHEWKKFVTPEEVQKWLRDAGCTKVRLVHGMFYIPFVNKWHWIPDTSVNYAVHAIKVAKHADKSQS